MRGERGDPQGKREWWDGPCRTPPPLPPECQSLVGGALCRAEPSHACGPCPMQGGTLRINGLGLEWAAWPYWWSGPILRRPCAARFKVNHGYILKTIFGFWIYFFYLFVPLWAPVRLDTEVMIANVL